MADRRRSFWVSDGLWTQAIEIAKQRGESISEVLRDALRRYVRRNRMDPELYRIAKERAEGKRPNVPWREHETAEERRQRWNAANPQDPIP